MSIGHEASRLTNKDTPAIQKFNIREHRDEEIRQKRLETSESRPLPFIMPGPTKEMKPLTTAIAGPITRSKKVTLEDFILSPILETVSSRGKARARAGQPLLQPSSTKVVPLYQSSRMIDESMYNAEIAVQRNPGMETSTSSAEGTQGEAREGSTGVLSSSGPTRSLKRKRVKNAHESRKIRHMEDTKGIGSSRSGPPVVPFQAHFAQKNPEVEKLRQELVDLRSAHCDLQEAKRTLAKELHRRHLHGKIGQTQAFKQALYEREEKHEVPMCIAIPKGFTFRGFLDMPSVLVKADRLEIGDRLRIRCEEAIGAGRNGKVIGGTVLRNDPNAGDMNAGVKTVAIKATMKSGLPSWDAEFFREIRILKTLGERGIAPRFVAVIESATRLLMVMERYPMSLWELHERLLDASCTLRLSTSEIQVLAQRLTQLVYRLHESGHIHRDLKPDNVLVSERGSMILADFGMTTRVGEKYEEDLGTSGFTVPFGQVNHNADPRVDIWSLGATILSLAGADLCAKPGPITEQDCEDAVETYFPKAVDAKAHDFVSKCLSFPKRGRNVMTAQKAVTHDWITEDVDVNAQEQVDLAIFRAAGTNQALLVGGNPYFLNIGEGPCRELSIYRGSGLEFALLRRGIYLLYTNHQSKWSGGRLPLFV